MSGDETNQYPHEEDEGIDEDIVNTPSGIKYMSYGYLSGIIGMVLVILMTFLVSSLGDKSNLIYSVSSLISMLSMILIIIGLFFIYKDRREYSENHERSVKIGAVMLVTAIVIRMSSFTLLDFIMSTDVLSGYGIVYTGEILTIISISLIALGSVYVIKVLAGEKIRRILWSGAGLNIGGAILGGSIIILITMDMIPISGGQGMIGGLVLLHSGLTAVSFMLFTVSYLKTKDKIMSER